MERELPGQALQWRGEPVAARPSASVILLRDGAAGLETFMVRRHASARMAPGAYVFPGGTVRFDDLPSDETLAADLQRALAERSDDPLPAAEAAAMFATAVRELFEEAGVLLARTADSRLMTVAADDTQRQERLAAARLTLQAGQLTLSKLLSELGAQPAYDCLVPFSHWVTPIQAPTRFDTRFFMAAMPVGQEALHCTIETTEGVWLRPARALEPDIATVFATEHHLRRIAEVRSVDDALDFARRKPIRRVQPEIQRLTDGVRVLMQPELLDVW